MCCVLWSHTDLCSNPTWSTLRHCVTLEKILDQYWSQSPHGIHPVGSLWSLADMECLERMDLKYLIVFAIISWNSLRLTNKILGPWLQCVGMLLVFVATLTQPRVSSEESLDWGIAWIRLACGYVYKELPWVFLPWIGGSYPLWVAPSLGKWPQAA